MMMVVVISIRDPRKSQRRIRRRTKETERRTTKDHQKKAKVRLMKVVAEVSPEHCAKLNVSRILNRRQSWMLGVHLRQLSSPQPGYNPVTSQNHRCRVRLNAGLIAYLSEREGVNGSLACPVSS